MAKRIPKTYDQEFKSQAVKLAQEYGLTMIGRAKNRKMMQYTLYKE